MREDVRGSSLLRRSGGLRMLQEESVTESFKLEGFVVEE